MVRKPDGEAELVLYDLLDSLGKGRMQVNRRVRKPADNDEINSV